MRRAFIVLIIVISAVLSSCITGGNVFSAESNGSMIIDALTESPARTRTEERPIEEVLAVPEVAADEIAVEDSVVQDENVPPAVPAETVPESAPEEEPAPEVVDQTPDVVFIPAVVNTGTPEEVAEPVADAEETTADAPALEQVPATPAAEESPTEPAVIYVDREDELIHYSVDGWMLRLMIVSIVSVILFTAATAVRSGMKRALSRGASLALAIVFTAVPWIITAVIAGNSVFWCIYLVLLLTYVIFRSENQRRGVR